MESTIKYSVLKSGAKHDTLDGSIRADLEDLERQLVSLLVTTQRMLGKEVTVRTRKERRQEYHQK